MRNPHLHMAITIVAALGAPLAGAAVPANEAARLKTELTPMGGERAGNKDGSIPAWSGGLTTPTPGYQSGGRRPDPFASEKPVLRITAKNLDQYAERLTEGTKALLKKYPESFRVDVYPTHRTGAAPQRIYDSTLRNATSATLVDGAAGPEPKNALGGVPFPIPRSGMEVVWNALLRWRGESWFHSSNGYQVTADGRVIQVQKGRVDNLAPYYLKDMTPEKFNGEYWLVRAINSGPPIRAGEAVMGRHHLDEDKSATWVYLTGQRRVRKLPNACCDTPTPFSAGTVSFDEIEGIANRQDRFDWKIVGKKEFYIPYNSNRTMVPTKDLDVVGAKHLNPDHVRWELHRVWVLESTLKPGQRHSSHRSRYYIDEDSWNAVLADRWDAHDQLWRMPFAIPVVAPDLPGVVVMTWGVFDLLTGAYYVNSIVNEQSTQYKLVEPRYSDTTFSPDALAGEGVR